MPDIEAMVTIEPEPWARIVRPRVRQVRNGPRGSAPVVASCTAVSDRIAVLRDGRPVDVVTSQSGPDQVTAPVIGDAIEVLDRPAPAQTEGTEPLIEHERRHHGRSSGFAGTSRCVGSGTVFAPSRASTWFRQSWCPRGHARNHVP